MPLLSGAVGMAGGWPAAGAARADTTGAAGVAGGSAGAAWLGSSPAESMMAALCALSLGILVYVIRRDRDLRRLAAQQRWRDRALAGKGVSLSDWRAGISPQPWPHRDSGAS